MNSMPRLLRDRQQGLSMIELMVALLLSTLLLLGVLQLFSNSSHSDKVSSALTRVQEGARVAFDLLAADARRAGYQGCQQPNNKVTLSNNIVLPRDAITTSSGVNTSVTFRYATTTVTAIPMPGINKTCTDQDTYLFAVTYSNCTNGTSICMNSSTSGGTQTIVDGAQITAINLGYTAGGNTVWKSAGEIQAADLPNVNLLQVSIRSQDANQNVQRDFSSTIDLRNRQ